MLLGLSLVVAWVGQAFAVSGAKGWPLSRLLLGEWGPGNGLTQIGGTVGTVTKGAKTKTSPSGSYFVPVDPGRSTLPLPNPGGLQGNLF